MQFQQVVSKLKLEHDSFNNDGKRVGDDICKKVVELGIKRLPPNKRFKKGIEVSKELCMVSLKYIIILVSFLRFKTLE